MNPSSTGKWQASTTKKEAKNEQPKTYGWAFLGPIKLSTDFFFSTRVCLLTSQPKSFARLVLPGTSKSETCDSKTGFFWPWRENSLLHHIRSNRSLMPNFEPQNLVKNFFSHTSLLFLRSPTHGVARIFNYKFFLLPYTAAWWERDDCLSMREKMKNDDSLVIRTHVSCRVATGLGTFEGRSTDWAIAPRLVKNLTGEFLFNQPRWSYDPRSYGNCWHLINSDSYLFFFENPSLLSDSNQDW